MFTININFILLLVSATQLTFKQPLEVQYYEDGLNRYFLDHTLQIQFEYVRDINITKNLESQNCQASPYEFTSQLLFKFDFVEIIYSYFDSEEKVLFIIENQTISILQFILENKSISQYHFRYGIANKITEITKYEIKIENGIQIVKWKNNQYIILNKLKQLFIFELDTKNLTLSNTILHDNPIWINSINEQLILAFNDFLIKYEFQDQIFVEIARTQIYLKDSKVISISGNYLFIELKNKSILKVHCSGITFNVQQYQDQDNTIISQTIQKSKYSYIQKDKVYLYNDITVFEQYDKIFHLEDLIILQSNQGVNKVMTEFTDNLSYPTFFYHQNIQDVYLMNNYGMNYHIISCSKNEIIVTEFPFTEAFIQCEGNIEDSKQYISFQAQADGCGLYNSFNKNESCIIEGQFHFNKIKTYITDESTIGLFVEIFVIIFFILSLVALLSTKNLQRKTQELTIQQQEIEKKKIADLERSEQNIINQKDID